MVLGESDQGIKVERLTKIAMVVGMRAGVLQDFLEMVGTFQMGWNK
jgi:hypothetical protein